jgi:hypothetical protein
MIIKLLTRRFINTALCCAGLFAASNLHADDVAVSGYLTGTNDWYRTNIYTLNGMVFVRSNGVLNIEAGTVIKGQNTGASSTNIAALVICRGAKIFAEGTAKRPIIFTAATDDTTLPDDLPIWGPTARGLWGGVVILGNTVINSAIDAAGHASSPKYEVYEGMPDVIVGGEALMRFGGTDDNDSSGVFRYVSIRHGGAALFPNKEINGLSLGAVGRGTKIEFVEAYCVADDGFEFFGGTVNTRYLVSSFNDDDSFDTDMGYRGTNQFWFVIQAPDKRNYGMELNSQVNEVPQGSQLLPAGDFKVYNMTVIGSGASNTVTSGGNNAAIALRSWSSPKIHNAIFTDFNERGIVLDTQNGNTATQSVLNGYAQLRNTLWWDFVTGSATANINNTATNLGRFSLATNYWTDTTLTNLIANPLLGSISRTNVGKFLDPRPKAGSPALSAANVGATPSDGFLTPVNYVGAFGPDDLWINGWTALSEYGILSPVGQSTNTISGYLSGTNNWYRTNIYILNGMVFVRSNGVLNIEAGTVIKGQNTGASSTNISALVICRGAKIFAEGTPQNPIIFTAAADDTLYPDDLPIWGPTARGLWGGVVILGNTVINSAIDAAGHASSPKYEVYEGMPDVIVGGEALMRFGGTDDNDSSGVFRYVSIRHGGAALFPNKEINGLSLGAVGRGTKIEFVEAYCVADDGFEFFGGTVNTRYLVSSFNDDDSFDTDMGYRGTNQFWFVIQAPDKRNYGMELNSQVNEVPQGSQLLPAGDFKVYNMTVIGSGASNTVTSGGNNAAIALRSWSSPKIHNAIFTDFNERGIVLDTQNGNTATQSVLNGYAQLRNTLWWDFVTGSATANINNTATNLGRFSLATNYWTDTTLTNLIANPQLTHITRTNVGKLLDPRPKAGSPAWDPANVGAAPGSLTAAGYIGAFGSVNWASDWTALGEYGILTGSGGGNPRTVSVAAPTPGQPTLAFAPGVGLITISFASQSGVNYQLQSATNLTGLPGGWANEGAAQPGTGGVLSFTPATAGAAKFFRVIVP